MSLLGASLVGQGKFKKAEPLLLNGYEKMPFGPSYRVNRLALERLIALYEAWDKPEKAEAYRAKRAKK